MILTNDEKLRYRIAKRQRLIDRLILRQQEETCNAADRVTSLNITKGKILSVVLSSLNTNVDDVFKKKNTKINRVRRNVEARQMYYYLCRRLTDLSLQEIGRIEIGNYFAHVYDHSTVIHGSKTWEDIISYNATKKRITDNAIKILENYE